MPNRQFTYQIIRSKRRKKTIILHIGWDEKIVVRAPWRVMIEEIDTFVHEKETWICRKLEEIRQKQPQWKPREFASGEEFPFLGQSYPLQIVKGDQKEGPLTFQGDRFHLSEKARGRAEGLFIRWYKDRAETVIRERVNLYRERLRVSPARERITSARHRWGSCSSQNALTFSWRMVMAPLPVIDYVVVHELAHIREKNHSSRFWKIVEQIVPGYQNQRDWLKRHGHLLPL